jgi:hypothetical protein
MAGRDGAGQKFVPGSRKYDRTIDDALRTMERFAAWLENAKLDNVWLQAEDALQVAMLHGMMTHLRDSIDEVLAQGGDEVDATAALLHSFAGQPRDFTPAEQFTEQNTEPILSHTNGKQQP